MGGISVMGLLLLLFILLGGIIGKVTGIVIMLLIYIAVMLIIIAMSLLFIALSTSASDNEKGES